MFYNKTTTLISLLLFLYSYSKSYKKIKLHVIRSKYGDILWVLHVYVDIHVTITVTETLQCTVGILKEQYLYYSKYMLNSDSLHKMWCVVVRLVFHHKCITTVVNYQSGYTTQI